MYIYDCKCTRYVCVRICRPTKAVATSYRAVFIVTFPSSTRLVSMTMVAVCCSQTILQKSSTVCSRGPCVAMYSCSLR